MRRQLFQLGLEREGGDEAAGDRLDGATGDLVAAQDADDGAGTLHQSTASARVHFLVVALFSDSREKSLILPLR